MSNNFLPKYSKDLPHHYFFSVAMYPITSKNAGKMYMKYGPVYVHNDDIDRVCRAMVRMNDEVFKQSPSEAMEIEECSELGHTMAAMRVSTVVNNCTMHHLSSREKLDDETLVEFVEMANTCADLKQKLMESKI